MNLSNRSRPNGHLRKVSKNFPHRNSHLLLHYLPDGRERLRRDVLLENLEAVPVRVGKHVGLPAHHLADLDVETPELQADVQRLVGPLQVVILEDECELGFGLAAVLPLEVVVVDEHGSDGRGHHEVTPEALVWKKKREKGGEG